MAAVRSGLLPGEIVVEVKKLGIWNMRAEIRLPPGARIHEIVATIEDTPRRIVRVGGQNFYRDQRLKSHRARYWTTVRRMETESDTDALSADCARFSAGDAFARPLASIG